MSVSVSFCLCCGEPFVQSRTYRYQCGECSLPAHTGKFCPEPIPADQIEAWRAGLATKEPLATLRETYYDRPRGVEWARYLTHWDVLGVTKLDRMADTYQRLHPSFGMAFRGGDPDFEITWAYMSGIIQAYLPSQPNHALLIHDGGYGWLLGEVVLQPHDSTHLRGFQLEWGGDMPEQRVREGEIALPYGPRLFTRLITASQAITYGPGKEDDDPHA